MNSVSSLLSPSAVRARVYEDLVVYLEELTEDLRAVGAPAESTRWAEAALAGTEAVIEGRIREAAASVSECYMLTEEALHLVAQCPEGRPLRVVGF